MMKLKVLAHNLFHISPALVLRRAQDERDKKTPTFKTIHLDSTQQSPRHISKASKVTIHSALNPPHPDPVEGQERRIIFLFLLLFLIPLTNLNAGLLFTDYAEHKPEDAIAKLQAKQVDYPNDPEINYNLGVAQYRAKKYADAQGNFQRAIDDSPNPDFKNRAHFNLGNSFYHGALSSLPKNWKKKETQVEQPILQKALEQAHAAVEQYKKVFEFDKHDDKAETNKKKTIELIKKLQEKQQQQDQQNKDNQKDKKDKQDQKDQQKQDQSQKNQDKQKDQQSKQDKEKDDKQKDGQDQPQGEGEQETEKSQGQEPEGKENESSSKDSGNDKKQDSEHNQDPSEKKETKEQQQSTPEDTSDEEKEQSEQAQAASGKEADEPEESMEKRGMRAVLQNLEQSEAEAQKRFMMQKMNQAKPPLKSGQKPW